MKALVLSGGANRGAYQCAATQYLINNLNQQYQIFTGISVGAINASFLSQYAPSNQKQGIIDLYNLWKSLKDSDVKKYWFPFGDIHGLWLDSVYNSNPLWNLVRKHISLDKIRASGNKVSVSAVSVKTGDYKTFTQDDDDFIDGVLASCAYPMGLKPITINGDKYTDGGVKHVTPISEAIKFSATDLDIIICSPPKTTATFDDVDTITFGLRCLAIMQDQMQASDLKLLDLYNKLVSANLVSDRKYLNYKIIRPTADLPGNSLTFDQSIITPLLAKGFSDAQIQYKI